jgi:hypothetical protein
MGNMKFQKPGSIRDRYDGVDLVYNGVNYQIKPLNSIRETEKNT